MVLSSITDGIARSVEGAVAQVNEALFEPVIRLGVTGLSRAGKTVFITGLVANLLDRGRMPQLSAAGRIEAAYLESDQRRFFVSCLHCAHGWRHNCDPEGEAAGEQEGTGQGHRGTPGLQGD